MTYDDYVDLDYFCYAVELNNSCQIAVLIVNTTQPVGINDYAVKTFEKNGIGQEGKDNGVLFVFSYSEEAWRVVTGAGVSDILNGARFTELRQLYLDPYLESGDYSTGIKLFVYAIGLELVDNYSSSGTEPSGGTFLGITLPWWQWAHHRRRRGPAGGGHQGQDPPLDPLRFCSRSLEGEGEDGAAEAPAEEEPGEDFRKAGSIFLNFLQSYKLFPRRGINPNS